MFFTPVRLSVRHRSILNMISFLKKAFIPKEVKSALSALDETACRFQTGAFQMIQPVIERYLLSKPNDFVRLIRES